MPTPFIAIALISCVGFFLPIFPGWFDTSELSLASHSLGVSHPTGHPVYLIFSKAFTFLPLGTIAWKTSLASLAALAASLYLIVSIFEKIISTTQYRMHRHVTFALLFAVTLNPLIGLQISRTEIYALACAQVLGIFLLFLLSETKQDRRFHFFASFLFGLGMATHPLIALCSLPCLVPTNKEKWAQIPATTSLTLLGYLSFLYLPLRSWTNPMINWGQPTDFTHLQRVLLAKDYQSFYLPSLNLFDSGVLLGSLLGATFFSFCTLGVFLLFRKVPMKIGVVYMSVLLLNFFGSVFTGVYRQNPDSYGYLMPSLFLMMPLFISGIWYAADCFSNKPLAKRVFIVGILAYFFSNITPAITSWRSHGGETEMSLSRTLLSMHPSSVSYVESDHWLFPFWYRQAVEQQRPDIVVAASGLLGASWYRNQVKAQNQGFLPTMEYWESAAWNQKTFLEVLMENEALQNDLQKNCQNKRARDRIGIHEGLCTQVALNIFQRHLQKKRYQSALIFAEKFLNIPNQRNPTKTCDTIEQVSLPFELKHRNVRTFLPSETHFMREYLLLRLGCGESLLEAEMNLLRGDFF